MRPTLLLTLLLVPAIGCDDDTSANANPAVDAGDPVTLGMAAVRARGCPTCHQSTHASDGTLAGQDSPRPGTMSFGANLTPDHATGIGEWSDDDIRRAIRTGVDDQDEPLCPPMPHFDGTGGDGRPISDDEALTIIAYLRSLPAVTHAVPQSTCAAKPPAPPPDLALPAPAPLDMVAPAD